ncbi:hypothetical protein [Enterobacter oligotrophicus]|uniref:hypothetical protein n=1 Tax=Enterobacter oligotrophicus TaxID=2478464 RepID=UPI0023F34453|nr:hypothetical protein [Enterobacter oligotrophicus]
MSTITRERLEEIAEDGFLKHGESKELARIALASLEAEPVALTVQCWSCRDEIEVSAIGDCDGYCPKCNSPIDLDEEPYTAQPAAVSVADFDTLHLLFEASERESDHGFNLHKYGIGYADEATQARWEAWVACRAAMLQGADGSSPVVPDSSEDTKRLNWLDAQNKRLNEYYGTSYGWKFDANFQRNAMMLNDSNYPVMNVRQAIDEAIAAAPQQE